MADTAPSDPKTNPPTPSPNSTPPPPAPSTPSTQEFQEKNVKKAFLEKFKLIKKDSPPSDSVSSPPPSNSPDSTALYQEINTTRQKDYLILNFHLRSLLIIGGVIIILMWLIVAARLLIETKAPRFAFWNPALQNQLQAEANPSPSPTPIIKIRLRNHTNATPAAQAIVQHLTDNGYPGVELVDDPESFYSGLSLITKKDQTDLRLQLEPILTQLYLLSSPSAELTQDSDFAAVILFGPNATPAANLLATPSATQTPTPTSQP